MKYFKVSHDDAKQTSWSYNPNGATESEKWLCGEKVKCQVYQVPELDQTVVVAKVEAGAFHGRTVAKSEYVYTVLLGRGEFFFYDEEKLSETVSVRKGDVIIIPAGVSYDYQAQSQDLEVNLVMHNLWDVDDD